MTFYKESRRELSEVRETRAEGAPRKRLVAKRRRYEGVYNRIAAASAILVRAGSARSTAVTKWFAERRSDGAGER